MIIFRSFNYFFPVSPHWPFDQTRIEIGSPVLRTQVIEAKKKKKQRNGGANKMMNTVA